MKLHRIFLSAFLLFTACGFASACPMCKDSIPNGEAATAQQAGGLPTGFNFNVYFMLGGLFLTLGMVGTVIYKGIRSTSPPRGGRGFDVGPPASS